MLILVECDQLGLMGALLFIKNIIKIICVAIPVLLLLFLTIDFVRATIEGDSEKMDKVKNVAVKRIIYAVIVFLIPTIVKGSMLLLGDTTKFSSCYDLAETSYVENLAEANRLEQKIKNAENEAKKAELQKQYEKTKKQMAAKRKKAIKGNSSRTSGVDGQYHKSKCKIGEATSSDGRVAMNNYYDNDWTYVARFKDPKQSNLAAKCINELSKRTNILYDRENYTSLWDEAAKHNFDIYKIDKKKTLYTTCCPFVTVCAKYAGVKGISNRSKTFTCNQILSEERESIESTGAFQIISWDKIGSCHNLKQGDIIFNKWHHAMAY